MDRISEYEWTRRTCKGNTDYPYIYSVHDGVGREIRKREIMQAGLYSGTVEYGEQRIAVEAVIDDDWAMIRASDPIDAVLGLGDSSGAHRLSTGSPYNQP